jgi:hypothetical protein
MLSIETWNSLPMPPAIDGYDYFLFFDNHRLRPGFLLPARTWGRCKLLARLDILLHI